MTTALALTLLAVVGIVGLALIPLGLPGLWLIVLGVLGYGWMTDFRTVGVVTVVLVLGLAFLGEIIESWMGFRYARKYGGSSRSAWGALAGGLVGAILGVPIPVIGSIIGAFLGSFAGAVVFEYTATRRAGVAVRAGWGSVVGRAAAAALKMGLGLVILVIGVAAVLRA